MKRKARARLGWLLAACLITVSAAAFPGAAFSARHQSGPPQGPPSGNPEDNGVLPAVAVAAADAARIPNAKGAPDLPTPARPAGVAINRPTVSFSDYRAMKRAAGRGQSPTSARPDSGALGPNSTTSLFGSFHAIDQKVACGCSPPDINAAVGTTQIAEITNSHLTVYARSVTPGAPLMDKTLNSLLGYATEFVFDPRIEYDTLWNRWVLSAEAFPESGTVQYQFLAISQTADATGGWWIYRINIGGVTGGDGSFWDYPQMSLTQDAVIVTANDFGPANYDGALTLAVAKAILYNGSGFSVPVFGHFSGTTTPPNVIDQNPRAHLIVHQSGTTLRDATFRNPQTGFYAAIASNIVFSGVPAFGAPPNAPQPGACSNPSCNVDTGDGRFVNNSTQYGDTLWNTNTTGDFGFATPRLWQFDTEGGSAESVRTVANFYATGTSYDWNSSVVAGTDGRAYVNWSWDNPSAGTNPSMAIGGRLGTDAGGGLTSAVNVITSPNNLQGNYDPNFGAQRWGDTSSVRFQPGSAVIAWAANEYADSEAGTNTWATRIAKYSVG